MKSPDNSTRNMLILTGCCLCDVFLISTQYKFHEIKHARNVIKVNGSTRRWLIINKTNETRRN